MPKITVDDVSFYYELHGWGEPVLLITGLGYGTWSWYRQIPALERHFCVLSIDNRGAGLSDKPTGPYSIAQMADDIANVMRELPFPRANVVGISMGGFIAQEL